MTSPFSRGYFGPPPFEIRRASDDEVLDVQTTFHDAVLVADCAVAELEIDVLVWSIPLAKVVYDSRLLRARST